VDHAFQSLENSMCSTHVLALPDFTNTFLLEFDASGKEIGVVLMQDGRPLAFTSKQLSERHLGQSIYEKEMLAIMHVVDLWHPYLLGQQFQIKTNHHGLKYFLEQQISSPTQQKWVTKIFGYDYEIIYNKRKENVVVDALSHKYEEYGSLFSLSFIVPGSKFFVKNGGKTPKFIACSTNCNTILQFLQGTRGIMKSFTRKVICIYARNPNLNPQ
jgi:hypothetical protein